MYELPTLFSDIQSDNIDAQIYVYSELIISYTKREFVVKIILGDVPKLYCSWSNASRNDDLDQRRKIINQYRA